MKAAFAIWNDRIAPVFDVARLVRLVEVESGRIVHEDNENLPEGPMTQKAARLAEGGVHVLVCGAISRPVQITIAAHGIKVFPFVAGNLRDIIQAWLAGTLENSAFAMPGCYGRGGRGRFRVTHQLDKEESSMGRGNRVGKNQGGGRRGGRRVGPAGSGSGGSCLCPECGHREPHQRGVPCFEQPCPKCGKAMIRDDSQS
jgi:predicted Fe-Mo cluster-binding NifX family protein